MPKDLERDLGLYATLTISIGAMIGSGIFVLPGLAAAKAGPAVVLAYFLAGVVTLPAALSKSEMATAMPEAGGTYLYIDRAMGPLPGTIAGIGAWFSLVFKAAFALVGLGAYLLVLVDLPAGSLELVGLGLAGLLVVVNVVGVKQSGRLQAVIVSLVLLSLVGFIADGITFVDQARYHPFFEKGPGGLLAATGFVFVSYAGVTKIASVAEEVEDPGRNIPRGILASVVLMMFVYTLVVFVVVGVSPRAELVGGPGTGLGGLTPMAVAAADLLGGAGSVAIAVVAVLALTSMANAGVLSSSRYPLAMSRDDLAPGRLGTVSQRFRTPVWSIGVTGAALLALVAFVPVQDLAKLASAFQILVFSLVNAALVAFREGDLPSYDPEFVAPGYPWVQLFGILAGGVLLTQMGVVPLVGAVGIVLAGLVWYAVYGRERTEREGAALAAIRKSVGTRSFERTRATVEGTGDDVLVPVGPDTTPDHERTLLALAGHVATHRDSSVHAVLFEEVPEQTTLSTAAAEVTPEDRAFERQTGAIVESLDAPIESGEIVSHDARRAVANYAEDVNAGLVLGEWTPGRLRGELVGYDVDWFMDHVPCEVSFVRPRELGDVDEIAVLTQRGPHGPLQVALAGAIGAETGATVRFVTAVAEAAADELVEDTRAYHDRLAALCDAETRHEVVRTDDVPAGLAATVTGADLAVVGVDPHTAVHDLVLGDRSNEIADRLDCSVLLVHSRLSRPFLRRVVKRFVF